MTNKQPQASARPARRQARSHPDHVECPRCGRLMATVIGRSESLPIIYLRCSECHQTSVAGA